MQPKAKPVLLNCSLNVTDKNLLPLRYKWLKDGEQIDKIRPKLKIEVQKNGSLLLQPRKNRSRNRRLDGVYDCLVTTANNTAVIARRVEVVVASEYYLLSFVQCMNVYHNFWSCNEVSHEHLDVENSPIYLLHFFFFSILMNVKEY